MAFSTMALTPSYQVFCLILIQRVQRSAVSASHQLRVPSCWIRVLYTPRWKLLRLRTCLRPLPDGCVFFYDSDAFAIFSPGFCSELEFSESFEDERKMIAEGIRRVVVPAHWYGCGVWQRLADIFTGVMLAYGTGSLRTSISRTIPLPTRAAHSEEMRLRNTIEGEELDFVLR